MTIGELLAVLAQQDGSLKVAFRDAEWGITLIKEVGFDEAYDETGKPFTVLCLE